jgi:hypothetical protein
MMARVQLLCAEYVVTYGHSSIKLWHSRTRCIKRISERCHLSRLSHFWRSYGDLMVVSFGVLNSLFDTGPLKWVKTWRTTHATNIRLKYTSTDGSPDNLGSFLTELWLFNDGLFEKEKVFLNNFVNIYDSPTSTFVTDVVYKDASIGGSFFWLWSLLTELWPNDCFVRWIRRFWPCLGHNFAKIDDNHKTLFWKDVFC